VCGSIAFAAAESLQGVDDGSKGKDRCAGDRGRDGRAVRGNQRIGRNERNSSRAHECWFPLFVGKIGTSYPCPARGGIGAPVRRRRMPLAPTLVALVSAVQSFSRIRSSVSASDAGDPGRARTIIPHGGDLRSREWRADQLRSKADRILAHLRCDVDLATQLPNLSIPSPLAS